MTGVITSRSNERVKYARSLQQQTGVRRREKKFVVEGVRLVEEALNAGLEPSLVFVEPEKLNRSARGRHLLDRVRSFDWVPVNDSVIRAVSDTQSPQGIVAVFPFVERALPADLGKLVLVLDGLSDPGNVGTVLRTAEAAGVRGVILAEGCVDPYNPKVLRGAMGAHFRLQLLDGLSWRQIGVLLGDRAAWLASAGGGVPYYDVDWTKPSVLVIGSEATGPGAEARRLAAGQITIPMAGGAESLNAAIAAAVILFEALRQQSVKTV